MRTVEVVEIIAGKLDNNIFHFRCDALPEVHRTCYEHLWRFHHDLYLMRLADVVAVLDDDQPQVVEARRQALGL